MHHQPIGGKTMGRTKATHEEDISMDGTLPHQADAPSFKGTGMTMKMPFVNRYGVVIGDSDYDSPHSPLNNWSEDVDPEIMSGDEWIHPTNDIGWNSKENRELLESKRETKSKQPFMHPMRDASFRKD